MRAAARLLDRPVKYAVQHARHVELSRDDKRLNEVELHKEIHKRWNLALNCENATMTETVDDSHFSAEDVVNCRAGR